MERYWYCRISASFSSTSRSFFHLFLRVQATTGCFSEQYIRSTSSFSLIALLRILDLCLPVLTVFSRPRTSPAATQRFRSTMTRASPVTIAWVFSTRLTAAAAETTWVCVHDALVESLGVVSSREGRTRLSFGKCLSVACVWTYVISTTWCKHRRPVVTGCRWKLQVFSCARGHVEWDAVIKMSYSVCGFLGGFSSIRLLLFCLGWPPQVICQMAPTHRGCFSVGFISAYLTEPSLGSIFEWLVIVCWGNSTLCTGGHALSISILASTCCTWLVVDALSGSVSHRARGTIPSQGVKHAQKRTSWVLEGHGLPTLGITFPAERRSRAETWRRSTTVRVPLHVWAHGGSPASSARTHILWAHRDPGHESTDFKVDVVWLEHSELRPSRCAPTETRTAVNVRPRTLGDPMGTTNTKERAVMCVRKSVARCKEKTDLPQYQ